MNRTAFVFLLMTAAIAGLVSCRSNPGPIDIHNSRISLDWDGVYTGTIPAADCPGINVRLKLNLDETFELTYDYIDRPGRSFANTGSFKWDDTGNIVNLEIAETPSYYRLGQNKLIQLDMQGNPITGKLADNYALTKER